MIDPGYFSMVDPITGQPIAEAYTGRTVTGQPGGLPLDTLATYEANKDLYLEFGRPTPKHYDYVSPGAGKVAVTSYDQPTHAVIHDVPAKQPAIKPIIHQEDPNMVQQTSAFQGVTTGSSAEGLLQQITALVPAAGAALGPVLAGVAPAVAKVGGLLAGAYGVSQMLGVQYPWETGAGEGFIAPWNRNIVQDEQGRWVTPETRPDLFCRGSGFVGGVQVVKEWTAGGWPFSMTSDGKVHTVTKSGIRKSWKPYKSVVLGKRPSTAMQVRAIRKLERENRKYEQVKRLAKRISK